MPKRYCPSCKAIKTIFSGFFRHDEKACFTNCKLIPIRVADPEYLEEIWPHLRGKARKRSKEIVELLDLIVLAKRS